MNKARFLELVKHPDSIQEKDLIRISELTSVYPFSQILHILHAKARKNTRKTDFNQYLNLAATYCQDREILHDLIEQTLDVPDVPVAAADPLVGTPPSKIKEPPIETTAEQPKTDTAAPTDENSEQDPDLQDLSASPHIEAPPIEEATGTIHEEEPATSPEIESFHDDKLEEEEQAVKEPSSDEDHTTDLEEKGEGEDDEEEEDIDASLLKLKDDPPAVTEQDNIQTTEPENSEADTQQESTTQPETEQTELSKQIEAEAADSGIHAELMKNLASLKESRKQYQEQPELDESELEAGDPVNKQKQIEIIDTFIKNSPVLSKPNLSADSEIVSQKDLSTKSGTFPDDLVSENLAKIFLLQGNKKDAIKIYKKLIRKFPEKKSYFADQIEKISQK